MADGTVKISITADAGDANKTVDGLNSKLSGIESAGTKGSLGIGKIVTALGLVKLASGAMDLLKSSLDGAISRYDTMNNFPRIMEQLGFSTDESTAAIDKLSDGVSGLPTPLNEIVKSAQGIALMTGDLDGATDTALALNNAFLSSGSSAADSSRGLQQYVQMLSRGEVDMESWRTLQETMGVALNETAKAFGFTGQSAQNDLYDALKDGSVTFDDFNAKIVELDGGVNGFSERAKTASAGIGTAFANMRTAVVRGLEGVIRSIDDALASNGLPSIQQMIEAVGAAFENVLSGMAAKIPSMIAGFVSFYNAIQPFVPAIIAIGAAFLTYQTIMAVVGGVTKLVSIATGILNAVLMANPIALVVAAIVGLVAAFIYLWNTNEGFKTFFINAWNIIKETAISTWTAIRTAWSTVGTFFTTLWLGIKTQAINLWTTVATAWNTAILTIKTMWAGVQVFFTTLWTTIKTMAITAWIFISTSIMAIITPFILNIQTFFASMATAISLIWTGIQMVAMGAWTLIKNVILAPVLLLIDLITGDFTGMASHLSQIWTNIQAAALLIWNGLKTMLSGIAMALVAYVIAIWNNLKTMTSSIFNAVKTLAINAWNAIKTGVINAANALKQGAINAWNTLKSSVISAAEGVKQGAINAWENLKTAVIAGGEAIKQGAVDAWNTLKDETSRIFNEVVDSIKSILDIDLGQIGKNIIQGLIGGIGSMIGKAKEKITEVANGIKDKITEVLGIASPSRWMRDNVGKYIPQGIAVGIEADTKTATKAMSNMASQLMMPKLTAESAMGIGNRMSTSPSSVSTTTNTNNYGSDSDTEVVALLRQIKDKSNDLIVDGTSMVKKLSGKIDNSQGQRTSYADWGLEING